MTPIQQNTGACNNFRNPKEWLIAFAVAGVVGYFGIIKPLENLNKRTEARWALEQAIHPTILNYEGTDSVKIQRSRYNYLFSKSGGIDYIYIKHANNLNTPLSEYELTTLVAEKGKVLYVNIETHIFKEKLPSRPQSHELLDFTNYYEISGKYDYSLPSFIAGKYQQKYDYYAHKLDSLENVFKEQQPKQNEK